MTAGLPPCSVNYYAPTRGKLLDLALATVYEQLHAIALEAFAPLPTPGDHTPAEVVECGVDFVEISRTRGGKGVTARHVLLAEAQFFPELAEMIAEQRGQ